MSTYPKTFSGNSDDTFVKQMAMENADINL